MRPPVPRPPNLCSGWQTTGSQFPSCRRLLPKHTRLRALLTGGDKLHHAPRPGLPFRLFNNYGPTENTVVTTWTEVPPGDSDSAPPIGRALDNVQVYILDRFLQPVPAGVPGE